MLIGVLADSHNRFIDFEKVLEVFKDVELIIHAGDVIQDAVDIELATGVKVVTVVGNCENNPSYSDELELVVEGWKVLIAHGHLYGVKAGLDRLLTKSIRQRAEIVVYGHTHMPHLAQYRKVVVVNPGSIALPRGGSVSSYGLIDVTANKLQIAIKSLEDDEILMQFEMKK